VNQKGETLVVGRATILVMPKAEHASAQS
jgi:hypothetical protein